VTRIVKAAVVCNNGMPPTGIAGFTLATGLGWLMR
jgi:hypothetical protein